MIRPATEKDIAAMLDIYGGYVLSSTATFEYTVPTLPEFTARFREITRCFPWLCCEEDGEILGYAYASAPFTRAAYAWCCEPSVYLKPGKTRQGIGRRLYEALEGLLKCQGFQISYALITEENRSSIRFHEALGYRTAGILDNCGFKFGRWLGLRWMEKRLSPVHIPDGAPIPWEKFRQSSQNISHILDKMSLP